MAVVVDNVSALMNGARLAAYDSTGRLWVAILDTANSRWTFSYSDNGTTFTEATSLRITSTAQWASFDIDATVDRAVFAYTTTVGGVATVVGTNSITSTSTWTSLPITGVAARYVAQGDIAAFVKPGSSNYYVATIGAQDVAGNLLPSLTVYEYTSAHAYVSVVYKTLNYTSTTGGAPFCTVDFRHTGDGSTVASSSPDLFCGLTHDNTDTVYFVRVPWNGSSWDTSSLSYRSMGTIGAWSNGTLSAAFDGTRYCMAWTNTALTGIDVVERDAGDTTTTPRTITALSDGNVTGIAVSYDAAGDMVVHAVGDSTADVKRTQFVRATGLWDSWTTIEATTAVNNGFRRATLMASKAWASGKGIAVGWHVSNTGFDITYEVDFVNTAPTAPTWVSPADGTSADEAATLALDWTFNDPDAGDVQTAYALKRVISGTTTYYRVSDTSWQGTEIKNTSATTSVTVPATWGADGESVAFTVKTWDGADVASPYSDTLTVLGSTPITPVITSPATDATVTDAVPTLTWTATEQTAYRLRWLTSADVVLYDSGKVVSTSKSISSPLSLDNGLVDLKLEVRVWNDDDLEGPTDTNTGIDVTYTPPVTPTLVVTAVPASGYISVAITNPAGGGGEPAVTENEVWTRIASGGRQVGERTVNDDGIRIATGVAEDATYLDYAAPSGVDLEYRVKGIASTGAFAWSAWT